MKTFLIVLALFYTLLPRDLMPDFAPVVGWVDDLVVWVFVVRYLYIRSRKEAERRHYQERQRRTAQEENRHADTESRQARPPDDPYQVLGIPRGATPEEIKSAYRTLANQYHPDKVAHLGEEFKSLAEKRFKEIHGAYRKLMSVR